MTRAVFVANAAMTLAAVALCVWHAAPDRDRLAFLATGTVYGVLLEQLVILSFDAYQYSADDFLLTVGDVPVVIGLGWTALIYSGREVGRRFDLSPRALPAFVALYVLHVDLAIDAVAIRVSFWTWTPPGAWFGVPLGNFLGWYLVAALFVAAWLGVRPRVPSRALAGVAAIVLAVVGLWAVLEVWTAVTTSLARKVAILGPLLALSAAVVIRDGSTLRPVDARLAAVPLLFHGFYLGLLFALGIYRAEPLLLVPSLAMLGVGLALHAGGVVEQVRSPRPA